MNNFEINYDLRPYLPDIYVKQNILTSFDSINNNNTVGVNSVIFIFYIHYKNLGQIENFVKEFHSFYNLHIFDI